MSRYLYSCPSLHQLQPNRVPVSLWVKEKKKWSKKTQPAAVLSKMFTLYKAAKVGWLEGVDVCCGVGCVGVSVCVGVDMWLWCVWCGYSRHSVLHQASHHTHLCVC